MKKKQEFHPCWFYVGMKLSDKTRLCLFFLWLYKRFPEKIKGTLFYSGKLPECFHAKMKNFTNFTIESMKKIMLSFVLLACIMLGTMLTALAKPETFYVKITLSDTCSPSGYHGYYCVRLNLTYNYTTIVCTAQNCRVIQGTYCYAFTCDFDVVAEEPYYTVAFVAAARYPSGDCLTYTGSVAPGTFYWSDMTDNNCIASAVTVIL